MTLAVIRFLGAALLLCLAIIGALTAFERPIPDVLVGTTFGALTGLLGVLSPRPDLSRPNRNRRSRAAAGATVSIPPEQTT